MIFLPGAARSELNGVLNPDPSIDFSLTAVDFGGLEAAFTLHFHFAPSATGIESVRGFRLAFRQRDQRSGCRRRYGHRACASARCLRWIGDPAAEFRSLRFPMMVG